MDGMSRVEVANMDPQIAALSTPPYPDVQPPQQDVDDFLRKKRKAREHKACYPCRQRKVKCDLTRPCQTCRDREHPQLCSYHPPNKRQSVEQGQSLARSDDASGGGGFVTLARSEFDFLCGKLNSLENSITDLKREMSRTTPPRRSILANTDTTDGANIDPNMGLAPTADEVRHADVHGVHMKNGAGEYVHFGRASIPGMLYALQLEQGKDERSQIQEMLGKRVLPLFGLDNESMTFPFVDLWTGAQHGSLARAQELARAVPDDAHSLSLFRHYKDMGYVVFPGVVSVEQLEADLAEFLFNRASLANNEGVTERRIYGKSYTWLALLFAVLASGAQNSSLPRKERELTSQVYVCCSFECLRFTNFLAQANLEIIQSLLVIGNVLMNNLNAGTAWALLGVTTRLAQSLGVHRPCPPNARCEETFPRSKVWWAIMWEDSLLSIVYDRTSAAGALDVSSMPPPQHFAPVPPYHAVMYKLSVVGLEIVRDRARAMNVREHIERICEHRDHLANIMREAAEYLRDSRKCTTTRETLEHWALYLHSSYYMSELCRPAINPNADPEMVTAFKQTCVDNLANTVEAFLGLNNITMCARQSWAALHRALGSALLLCIIGENTKNERARGFVERFANVMLDFTNSIDPQEISAPIQRSLEALRKLGATDGQAHEGGLEALLKLEGQASLATPADSSGTADEASPYSVLNTILWGSNGAGGNMNA